MSVVRFWKLRLKNLASAVPAERRIRNVKKQITVALQKSPPGLPESENPLKGDAEGWSMDEKELKPMKNLESS
jgi:hypothetical protein